MDLAQDLARRTLDLCRVSSPYGDEAAIADRFHTWARGRFGEDAVQRFGHSVVAGRPTGRRPAVALVGHLDTVPGQDGDPPPAIEGDRVVGLGSSDMKSGLAVLEALCDRIPPAELAYDLVVVLYDKEEGPHEGSGLRVVLEEAPWLRQTDLAFVLEPTDGVVQIGCLGSLHATLSFRGKRTHSARPWLGENAITRAGGLLAELHERPPHDVTFAGQVFREVMTVTLASGGRFRNVVPDLFELNLNYRTAPGKSVEAAQREVENLVAGRADITWTDLAPSGAVPEGNALFDRFLKLSGLPVAPKQAWTDVARLTEAGIDAVNFGPGLASQAHQAGEYCEIPLLAKTYEALRRFLTAGAPALG